MTKSAMNKSVQFLLTLAERAIDTITSTFLYHDIIDNNLKN